MKDNNKLDNIRSCSFLETLTLMFVVAKLFKIINWSWWLVFTPYIISFLILLLYATITVLKEKREEW